MTQERRPEPPVGGSIPPVRAKEDSIETLDESAVQEVAPASQLPPVVAARGSSPAAREPGRDSQPVSRRGRARMTLRIPDDEVSRPTTAVPPLVENTPPLPGPGSDGALTPMRIISLDPIPAAEPMTQEVRAAAKSTPSLHTEEDSWTPYQPTAIDRASESKRALPSAPPPPVAPPHDSTRPPLPSEDMIPIDSDALVEMSLSDSIEPLELDDAEAAAVLSSRPPAGLSNPPPVAIPPAPPPPVIVRAAPPPPPRALAPTRPEGNFGSAPPMSAPTPLVNTPTNTIPAPPPVHVQAGERLSEPAAEIIAEELVSVESVPVAKAAPVKTMPIVAPPPPMRPRVASVPPPVPASLATPKAPPTALLTSVPPPPPSPSPATQAPYVTPVAHVSPATHVAPVAPVQAPSERSPSSPQGADGRAPLVIVPAHVGVSPPSGSGVPRKQRPWWEDLFNDDFIRTMAKISDTQIAREADFIEDSLSVQKGGTMLDLACGTGRHAIELSRRGFEVVGFDLSLAMLARAADEAQERATKLNFVQGDMREMTFEEAFDGVYSWNTSFGFFDEEKNNIVLNRVHRSLKKGGQFLLDVVNRDYIIRQAPSLAWFEGDGCVCMDEMQIDWITSRMKIKRTLMLDDGRSKEIEYSVRVYALHELGKILNDQGFRVCEVSGRVGTPGVFFGNESPRTLILAEKR